MKNEKIILSTDDEAAKFVTEISGWVDRNGRFFGKDERAARYSGSTHNKCECGNTCSKNRIFCDPCADRRDMVRYSELEYIDWDGEGFVYSELMDKYFDEQELIDHLEENEDETTEDLMLVNCEPNYLSLVSDENWCDELSEDQELPSELLEALESLNVVIDNLPPINFSAGSKRIVYKYKKD